jgi:thiaminase (transcriptional activator TenA)
MAPGADTSSFSEELRQTTADQWDRVVTHRFSTELAEGTIDHTVLARYLIQDHRFLDAFIVLLASMVASARCLADRIEGCQFLAVLTGKENTYFERSFAYLEVSNEDRLETPNADVTDRFLNLMRTVAKNGTLGEKLAVLCVCEWTYLSWGKRVQGMTNRVEFCCYEWVDLHSGRYFESVVAYLRRLLDQEGVHLNDAGRHACRRRFLETVQLEEEFFDYAYQS